ncbi:MAG: hypothetical protein Q9162_005858 [Coniocarpon cinnabarinum]
MAQHMQIVDVDDIPYHTILDLPEPPQRKLHPGQVNLGNGLVVLTHALMANSSMWDSTVSALTSEGYTCLRFDHVGHGGTRVPATLRPPSLADSGPFLQPPQLHFDSIARHIRTIIAKTTGQTNVRAMIGCSMGGVLALRFAMMFPECFKVDGCIVVCDPPGVNSLEEAKPKWSQRIEQFARDEAGGGDLLRHATVERWIPFPLGEDHTSDLETVAAREKALSMVRQTSLDGYRLCADGIRNYQYRADLDKIKARTMVLVGELDEAVGPRSVTEDIARRIDGAEYFWMLRAGH